MEKPTLQRWVLSYLVASIVALALLALLAALPDQPARAAEEGDKIVVEAELWRLAVTTEGEAAYSALAGRAASEVATWRSNRGVSDLYAILPAPGITRTIQGAQVLALAQSGAYSGTASLRLEVRDMAGTLVHTASAAAVDLAALPVGSWQAIPLVEVPDALVVLPGEYVAYHLFLESGPGGDLEAQLLLEVEAK